jgi:hypothetical protein
MIVKLIAVKKIREGKPEEYMKVTHTSSIM